MDSPDYQSSVGGKEGSEEGEVEDGAEEGIKEGVKSVDQEKAEEKEGEENEEEEEEVDSPQDDGVIGESIAPYGCLVQNGTYTCNYRCSLKQVLFIREWVDSLWCRQYSKLVKFCVLCFLGTPMYSCIFLSNDPMVLYHLLAVVTLIAAYQYKSACN